MRAKESPRPVLTERRTLLHPQRGQTLGTTRQFTMSAALNCSLAGNL